MTAPENDQPMSFWEHLDELRSRVRKALIAYVLACFAAWYAREEVLRVLAVPFHRAWAEQGLEGPPSLNFAAPGDALVAYFKQSMIVAVVAAGPFIFWQLWAFIAPGLYAKEKRSALAFVLASTVLFLIGCAFAWQIAFPGMFGFFLEQAGSLGQDGVVIKPTVMLIDYLDFVGVLFLGFGFIFEIPLVSLFLSVTGIVNYRQMWAFGRWFVLIAFILGAVLTPPDVGSQLVVAVPMCLLYGFSIGLAYIFGKHPDDETEDDGGERLSLMSRRALRRSRKLLMIVSATLFLWALAFGVYYVFSPPALRNHEAPAASGSASSSSVAPTVQQLISSVGRRRAELDAMIGPMVPVAEGKYTIGAQDGHVNEAPRHAVSVAAFEIDETEVSVAAYQLCVSGEACSTPFAGEHCNWALPARRHHPINCVTQAQAQAFCKWAGKRLPSEVEWESAARGEPASSYPWGEGVDGQPCWKRDPSNSDTDAGGTCGFADFPRDVSLIGLRGMAGNVSEWTSSRMCPYSRPDCETPFAVVRGGAWNDSDPVLLRTTSRLPARADAQSPSIGFRCVREPLPSGVSP